MKKCSRCQVEKESTFFGKDKYTIDGLRCSCNECQNIERKKRWASMTNEEKQQRYKNTNEWRNSLSEERKEALRSKMRIGNLTEEKQKLRRLQAIESAKRRPKEIMINAARQRAKKKSLDFDITVDDIEIPEMCPVLGIPLIKGDGRLTENSPTIDRIDNTKGYIKGNVMVISHRANNIKNSSTIKEIEMILEYMKKYQPLI
jgi:hypothetical protein